MHRSIRLLVSILAVLAMGLFLPAQGQKTQEPQAQEAVGAIVWFGTWEAGKKEARRTGRPILLVAAAPHCKNVPGIW